MPIQIQTSSIYCPEINTVSETHDKGDYPIPFPCTQKNITPVTGGRVSRGTSQWEQQQNNVACFHLNEEHVLFPWMCPGIFQSWKGHKQTCFKGKTWSDTSPEACFPSNHCSSKWMPASLTTSYSLPLTVNGPLCAQQQQFASTFFRTVWQTCKGISSWC